MKRVLLSIASALTAVILIPAVASADPGVTDVSGVVSLNGHHVGSGITVTVSCKGNILTDTTDGTGTYMVQYSQTDCNKNQTVTVSATVNGHKGSNTGKASGLTNKLNIAIVDVNVVPEFGLMTAAGAGIVGGAGFLVVRRRQISGHQA